VLKVKYFFPREMYLDNGQIKSVMNNSASIKSVMNNYKRFSIATNW